MRGRTILQLIKARMAKSAGEKQEEEKAFREVDGFIEIEVGQVDTSHVVFGVYARLGRLVNPISLSCRHRDRRT